MRRLVSALITTLSTALLLSACAGPDVQDYAQEQPRLDLRQYFNGPMTGHGVFTDRSGRVKARFVVRMNASWKAHEGVLEEDFDYSDGRKERRVWRLTHLGDGRYSGRADDVAGEAQGQSAGNALRWAYTLKLPVDGKVYEVQFDDWMFLVDEHVMINRARMSKFGVHLGDVTLSFQKNK